MHRGPSFAIGLWSAAVIAATSADAANAQRPDKQEGCERSGQLVFGKNGSTIVGNPTGLRLLVFNSSKPALRVLRPGHPTSDTTINVLFPEHVTAVTAAGEVLHLYLFSSSARSNCLTWRKTATSLEYWHDLPGGVRFLARATIEGQHVVIHYEFTNQTAAAYNMIYAVTDPRLTGELYDVRLRRTYVHDATFGFDLLARDTPARLRLPLAEWLPLRYRAWVLAPVPAQLIQQVNDAGNVYTVYNKSRRVDAGFIATTSTNGQWVVASYSPDATTIWSNPALTCQHVDPQTSLAAFGRATLEMKLVVIQGSLDQAWAEARGPR